ncbi:hypothetical protein HDU96_000425 [Phlyctochytrium bullatum]|nr:hypothetical protein HDU96_000425 [Phlyctochytrium bullatum]
MATSGTKLPNTPNSVYHVLSMEQPPVPPMTPTAGSPTDPEASSPASDGSTPLLREASTPSKKAAVGGEEDSSKVGLKSANSLTSSRFGISSRGGCRRAKTKSKRDSDSLASVAMTVNLYLLIPFLTEFVLAVTDMTQSKDPFLQCVQSVLNSSKGMWTLLFLSRDPTIVRTLKQAFGIRSGGKSRNGLSKLELGSSNKDDEW